MNHPVIFTAFENAERRYAIANAANANANPNDINENVKIYIIFKRVGIFYKESYYILTGTREEVAYKCIKAYQEVEQEKLEYPRADHIELLDTPMDSWCNESCIYKRMPCCRNNTIVKCATNWSHTEYTSNEELNYFTANIKPEYYTNFSVDYM